MKLIRSLIISSLMLTVIMITGCNEGPTTSSEPYNTGSQLSKFSLPAGATLTSATLHIYISQANNDTVDIFGISSTWQENTVTWATKPSIYAPIEGTFVTDAVGWKSVTITGLVGKWFDGTYTNFGLLLDQRGMDPNNDYTLYDSRRGTNKPYLEIVHSLGTANLPDSADAYIWAHPDWINYTGNNENLWTGYASGYEKQSLMAFAIEPTPPSGGCTYTIGYWKTHSHSGPAPYDNTWALLPGGLEENTIFFLSTKTWYQVFDTAPAGNPYYQVAHQYMGAQLNFLHGADPSVIQTAFDAATALFEAYTPAQVAALPNNSAVKQQFKALIQPLTDYNEGIIGPGHCD